MDRWAAIAARNPAIASSCRPSRAATAACAPVRSAATPIPVSGCSSILRATSRARVRSRAQIAARCRVEVVEHRDLLVRRRHHRLVEGQRIVSCEPGPIRAQRMHGGGREGGRCLARQDLQASQDRIGRLAPRDVHDSGYRERADLVQWASLTVGDDRLPPPRGRRPSHRRGCRTRIAPRPSSTVPCSDCPPAARVPLRPGTGLVAAVRPRMTRRGCSWPGSRRPRIRRHGPGRRQPG